MMKYIITILIMFFILLINCQESMIDNKKAEDNYNSTLNSTSSGPSSTSYWDGTFHTDINISKKLTNKSLLNNTETKGVIDWGKFKIVSQIGNNYNKWFDEKILSYINQISMNIESDDPLLLYQGFKEGQTQGFSDGVKYKIEEFAVSSDYYSQFNPDFTDSLDEAIYPGYDYKIGIHRLNSKRQIMILFNQDKTKIKYIEDTLEDSEKILETREFYYELIVGNKTHIYAGFYRKTADNMNDIIEIYIDNNINKKFVKCQRVYNINGNLSLSCNYSTPDCSFIFTCNTDMTTSDKKTIGIIYYDGSSLPVQKVVGLYNSISGVVISKDTANEEYQIDIVDYSLRNEYPVRDLADNMKSSGISHYSVKNYNLDLTININLENPSDPYYYTLISNLPINNWY